MHRDLHVDATLADPVHLLQVLFLWGRLQEPNVAPAVLIEPHKAPLFPLDCKSFC